MRRIGPIITAKYAVIMTYIHEHKDWPAFRWSQERLADRLASVRHRQGRLIGRMEALGFQLRAEAVLQNAHRGRPEIQRDRRRNARQGPGALVHRAPSRAWISAALVPADRNVEGVVEMMLDATQNYRGPLTEERLFGWHAALFPTGRSGMQQDHRRRVARRQRQARCRSSPVRSDANGSTTKRPHADSSAKRCARSSTGSTDDVAIDPVLKAGVAHLWFVTIHPFDDGNGRIARAIADMALARSEQSPQRFYSMSAQIRLERNAYYDILEATQKGDLDVTAWLRMVPRLPRPRVRRRGDDPGDRPPEGALLGSSRRGIRSMTGSATSSIGCWTDSRASSPRRNGRSSPKCSQDTALRDIHDLVKRGILVKDAAGGRSTSYSLREV